VTSALTVTSRTTPASTVLTLTGELDVATSLKARGVIRTLTVASGRTLIVDLSGVTFCDSSGISALLAARNHALASDAGIALVNPPPQLRRALKITGLEDVLLVYPSIENAEER